MSSSTLEDVLVLELPRSPIDDELGLDTEIDAPDADDGSETVGLDDGLVIDFGDEAFVPSTDELSWLDAGDSSPDLEVGGLDDVTEGSWLDDRPMAIDIGLDADDAESGADTDEGAEGLDEPRGRGADDDDAVDLPPMPDVVGDDGDLDPTTR